MSIQYLEKNTIGNDKKVAKLQEELEQLELQNFYAEFNRYSMQNKQSIERGEHKKVDQTQDKFPGYEQ